MTDRLDEIRARLDGAPLSSAASWIVEVKDDISFLLGEVERLTAERDGLRALLDPDEDPRLAMLIALQPAHQPVEERHASAYTLLAKVDMVDPIRAALAEACSFIPQTGDQS
jgi:hypothetical protein